MIPVVDSPLNNAHLLILRNISNLSLQRSFCPDAQEWRGASLSGEGLPLPILGTDTPILVVTLVPISFLGVGVPHPPASLFSHLELLLWKSVLHAFQTLSHFSHLFFFETLTRGHTVSLNPVSLRRGHRSLIRPVLTRTGPAPVLFWMDHLSHSPPSQNVVRAERCQPVPRLCFHYQRTWALSAQQMPRCTHRCRSWLFLAPIYSFALISCFSASPWFLFPPHSTPQNCKFFSNTNFPFEPPTFRAVSHAGRAPTG